MNEALTGLSKYFGTSLCFVSLFHPENSFHDVPPQSAISLVLTCIVRSLVSIFFFSDSEQLLKTFKDQENRPHLNFYLRFFK